MSHQLILVHKNTLTQELVDLSQSEGLWVCGMQAESKESPWKEQRCKVM